MAKTKRKHLAAIAAMKESHRAQRAELDRGAELSPLSAFDDKDSWVEVRKQKIIILIPPLPKTQKPRKWGKRKKAKLPEAALRESIHKDMALESKTESRTIDQDKVNRKLLEAIVELGGCPTEKVSNGCISSREPPNDTANIHMSFCNVALPETCAVESTLQTVPSVGVRQIKRKRKWKHRKSTRNRASRRRRKSVARPPRGNSELVAQPMSNMDVLLASVETIHAEQMMPLQGASRIDGCELDASHEKQELHQQTDSPQPVVGSVQENASFDTADSTIQPKATSVLQDGRKSSLDDGDASLKQAVEPGTSLCMPKHIDLPRKEESNHTPEAVPIHKTESPPERREERDLLTVQIGKFQTDLDEKLSSGSVHREERVFDGYYHVHPSLSTNQTLKVLTLKKQLEKAGGLTKWLVSVGLDQFVGAFEKRMFSELELLQLNMDDLKQMGSAAVGPRRKLIWALSHLSQQVT